MGLQMKIRKLYFLDKTLKKYVHNENGAAIAMVVILVTALIIFGAIFSRFALYNYEMSSLIAYGDSAYFGAEAAAEKWYVIVREILKDEKAKLIGIDLPIDYGKEREYVLSVLERIRVYGNTGETYHKELEKDLENFLKNKFLPDIEIIGPQNRTIEATFGRFEVYHANRVRITSEDATKFGLDNDNQLAIKARVGFVIVANVKNDGGKILTANKRIYVEKELYIPYYEHIQALGSMYSIGDVIVIGNGGAVNQNVANVYGDIFSFGTYPREIRRPEQWSYGGVMARQNARLNVMGNVYTRSFLRAGDYVVGTTPNWRDIVDASEIRVTRDVFAQGVQTFSKESRIYIYGSAFTLDDVEINADDSIIGINGNFVGLSTGINNQTSASNHDESSAILNSGQLHYTLANQPLKSRIVINGDVIVPGVGWKIDNKGVANFPIESGGLIYPKHITSSMLSQDVPAYRHEHKFDIKQGASYEKFLYGDSITDISGNSVPYGMNGYINIIQAFTPANTSGFWDINNGRITEWIKDINSSINSNQYGNNLTEPVTSLSGFSSSIIGANDSIYWNNEYNPIKTDSPIYTNNRFPIEFKFKHLDNFSLDGFLPSEINLAFQYNILEQPEGIDLFADESGMDFNVEADRDLFLDPDPGILENHPITQHTKSFWKHYWKPWNISNWEQYKTEALGYKTGAVVPQINTVIDFYEIMINHSNPKDSFYTSRLNGLKKLIEQRLNRIASRSYPDNNSKDWDVGVNDDLNLTFERIKTLENRGTDFVYYNEDGTYESREINYKALIKNSDKDKYFLLANEQADLDIVIDDEFRGIIITKGRVILTRGAKVYGTIFATGRKVDSSNNSMVGTLEDESGGNLNAIDFSGLGWSTSDLAQLYNGDLGGIVFDLRRNVSSINPPEINFYLGEENQTKFNTIFGAQRARFELLDKFRKQGVELYQIF
jgi:hypothetical protein